jgi:RND family efflux transporter MFP subunit
MNRVKGLWWRQARAMAGAVVCLGVIAAVGFVVLGHGKEAPAPSASRPERRAVAVTVEPVVPRPVRRTVSVVGSLYGRDEITITPKVEGRIVRIHKDVSDRVKPGEVLLEIDPTDYQLAVGEARRALELELAKLGLKELPAKGFDVTTVPPVLRAAALEKNAGLRRERMARLGSTAASTEDRDQAACDHEVARANYRQSVLEAEATLASARYRQAVLDTALQKLRDTRVLVPTPPERVSSQVKDYVVAGRSVGEGEIVQTMVIPGVNSNLFRLVIDRSLKLQAAVPERHSAEVRVGQEVRLRVEAYPGETFAGKVARINPTVDRASRTFQVEIQVDNGDLRLHPGAFARAEIETHIDPTARTVPEEALVTFAGVTKLFVVRDGKAHEVQVTAGVPFAVDDRRTWVEVKGDLPANAAVVTSGQSQLADRTPVRERPAQ